MAPSSLPNPAHDSEPILDVIPVLSGSVRGALIGLALGLLGIFSLAAFINPYEADGSARKLGTHIQLGLTECGFLRVTGIPCPSCGMTTSFALLLRGDLVNSLQANLAGTGLALVGMVTIPWCLISAWRRQILFIRSVEWTALLLVLVFAALMLLRWLVVVAWALGTGGGAGGTGHPV